MNEFFANFYTNFLTYYTAVLLYAIFVLVFRVLMMLAVSFDCKSRNNQNYVMWIILCFFFPIIASIVYACRRDKVGFSMRQCKKCGTYVHPDAQLCPVCNDAILQRTLEEKHSNQKKSHMCFGVSIGAFVFVICALIAVAFSMFRLVYDATEDGIKMADDLWYGSSYYEGYDYEYDGNELYEHYAYKVDGVITFYDKNGKAYTNEDDIVYYDRDGKIYFYDSEDDVFEGSGNIELDEDYCYIDENGFLYFDEAGWKDFSQSTVNYSAQYSNDYTSVYIDSKGVKYFPSWHVSWDRGGNIVDSYYGTPLLND